MERKLFKLKSKEQDESIGENGVRKTQILYGL